MILEQGLEAVEVARLWYHRKLDELRDKRRCAGEGLVSHVNLYIHLFMEDGIVLSIILDILQRTNINHNTLNLFVSSEI